MLTEFVSLYVEIEKIPYNANRLDVIFCDVTMTFGLARPLNRCI